MTTTANKALSEPANGATGWDVPLNANFTNIDQAFGGTQAFNLGGASGTIGVTGSTFVGSYPSNTASYIPLIWSLSGIPTGAVTLQIASGVSGQWTVVNACTGSFAVVTVSSAGGGTTVTVSPGASAVITVNSSGAFIAGFSLIQGDLPYGSAISLTTAVPANITSVSLPAGTWQITSNVQFSGTTTNTEEVDGWVSSTYATYPPPLGAEFTGLVSISGDTFSNAPSMAVGTIILTLNTTTTIYLSAQAYFVGGTQLAYGLIQCLRLQ